MPSHQPLCICGHCRRCKCRLAQRRYRKTEKGRATHRRYRQSGKGRIFVATLNARRIMVGERCHGYAKTVEHAARINAHIKERLREFKQRFSDREKT